MRGAHLHDAAGESEKRDANAANLKIILGRECGRRDDEIRPNLFEHAFRNSVDDEDVFHAMERPAFLAKLHNVLRQ